MELNDYHEKAFFTPFELEHILQLPLSELVELFVKIPKVSDPRGCYEAKASRELLAKLSRRRVYVDIIARNAVNAEPDIRRGSDHGEDHKIALKDVSNGKEFEVRFPGDLKLYLDEHFKSSDGQE